MVKYCFFELISFSRVCNCSNFYISEFRPAGENLFDRLIDDYEILFCQFCLLAVGFEVQIGVIT